MILGTLSAGFNDTAWCQHLISNCLYRQIFRMDVGCHSQQAISTEPDRRPAVLCVLHRGLRCHQGCPLLGGCRGLLDFLGGRIWDA